MSSMLRYRTPLLLTDCAGNKVYPFFTDNCHACNGIVFLGRVCKIALPEIMVLSCPARTT